MAVAEWRLRCPLFFIKHTHKQYFIVDSGTANCHWPLSLFYINQFFLTFSYVNQTFTKQKSCFPMKIILFHLNTTLFHIKNTFSYQKHTFSYEKHIFNIKITHFHIKITLFPMKITHFHIKTTLFYIKITLFHIKNTHFPAFSYENTNKNSASRSRMITNRMSGPLAAWRACHSHFFLTVIASATVLSSLPLPLCIATGHCQCLHLSIAAATASWPLPLLPTSH
jgi:hypothetical protein